MRFSISFPAWSALFWDAGFTLQSKRKGHDCRQTGTLKNLRLQALSSKKRAKK
jgi:hypothetical protein